MAGWISSWPDTVSFSEKEQESPPTSEVNKEGTFWKSEIVVDDESNPISLDKDANPSDSDNESNDEEGDNVQWSDDSSSVDVITSSYIYIEW